MGNKKFPKRTWLLLVAGISLAGFLLGATGWFLYTGDARGIHHIVYEDCREGNPEQEKVIVSHELLRDMSVIPKAFDLPYGYKELVEQELWGNEAKISHILNSAQPDWESLSWYAAMEECNYLVYPLKKSQSEIIACGYEEIGTTDNYSVYRHNSDDFNQSWLVTQYGNGNTDQLMFYTLQNRQGNLIVVDGGWTHHADYVREVIADHGNHVDAWIITHPHVDHVGAFLEVYPNPGDMIIDKVYAVDMAPPALCQENASWDDITAYEQWLTLDIPNLTYVHTDNRFEIAGLDFHILSAYGQTVDEFSNDLLNDGSMMFKITAGKESMLFCADVGISMSDHIIACHGQDLPAKYLQMGHHGNGGLSEKFYQIVDPDVAFFDAPDWLMEDANNQYTTPENKEMMIKLGAEVYSFTTAPNNFILE